MRRITKTVEQRFWEKVQITPTCWLWAVYLNPGRYGQFYNGIRVMPAHRFSYELHKGPIPAGLVIDHLCRIRHCVNPDHLEPVTIEENVKRGIPKPHNSNKTHCVNGHEFNQVNTHWYKKHRRCRICDRIRIAKRRAKGE